jgi:hypothetical protein
VHDAQQGAVGQRGTVVQPRLAVLPPPSVHTNLAPLAALAAPNEHGTGDAVEIALGQRASASLIRNPARQSTMISARTRRPSGDPPAARMTVTISSTVGGSAG